MTPDPEGVGSIQRAGQVLRNRIAPAVVTAMLTGADRVGVLGALRRVTSRRNYQIVLRTLNPSVRFIPRAYIDNVLMPATHPREGGTVVIVGIRSFALHYSWFYLTQRVVIFDPDPGTARYRGRAEFFAEPISRLGTHVAPATVDLVHFNGVYGWGLDDAGELERSLVAMRDALVEGGLLLVGYNLAAPHNPLGWTAETALPVEGLEELRAPEYPVYLDCDLVLRVFRRR